MAPRRQVSLRRRSINDITELCDYREWVSKCLSEMTESNRAAANAELKQVLHTATSNNTLWTTDWANVKLESSDLLSLLPHFAGGFLLTYCSQKV
jgi:hypothetical protein